MEVQFVSFLENLFMREQHSLSGIGALEAATPAVSIKSTLMNVRRDCHSFVSPPIGMMGCRSVCQMEQKLLQSVSLSSSQIFFHVKSAFILPGFGLTMNTTQICP